jgi:hypothetical protein
MMHFYVLRIGSIQDDIWFDSIHNMHRSTYDISHIPTTIYVTIF